MLAGSEHHHWDFGLAMGIKFLCPNGHKLHVKAFLSGKKAICPKCGARVVVPESHEADDGLESGSWAGTPSFEIELASTLASDGPAAAAVASTQPTPAAAAAREPLADPLSEAPQAAWYVRPATGGQYGPASAEIMRAWLAEGRIGASSLVWRAPWPEWRSAASAFPQLNGPSSPDFVPPTAGALPVGLTVSRVGTVDEPARPRPAESPLAEASRKRRRQRDASLWASAILLAISVVLVIVLVFVFRAQRSAEAEKIEPAPPAGEESPI